MDSESPNPRPLRVLHVLNELRASGAEVMLRSAADRWKEHGIESHILAVAPAIGPLARDLRAVGYRVAHLPDSPLQRVPFRLRRHVRAGGFGVVHLHAERGNFWFALAALSAGAAVVRTVHSVFQFHGPLRAERSVQRRVLTALGSAHVAVSGAVAENELSCFGNTAQVVENWYDSAFSPPSPQERARARADLGFDERHLVAVSVGNCSSVKRHDVILKAMVHPMSPVDLMYLHVGQEDEAHSERCLADRLGVAKRTRFLGLDHPLKALHAADVFVMPSSREGAGIAAIEALATGLPAILANVPGLRDLATAGPAVTLTEATPEAFARALAVAGRGEHIRGAPGVPGDRFGLARGVEMYTAIYQGLLDGRGR